MWSSPSSIQTVLLKYAYLSTIQNHQFMKKTIALLTLILVSTANMYACTCIKIQASLDEKVKYEFSKSDLIFTGKVIDKEIKSNGQYISTADPVIYTLEIIYKIKGNIETRTIEIISARSVGSCGYPFQVGESYLVYSIISDHWSAITEKKSVFITGQCRRNQKLKETQKRELNILKKLAEDS